MSLGLLAGRAAAVGLLGALALVAPARPPAQSAFAARIAALSEPPGYFDTDNLISNEGAYLHVLPDLQRAGLRGGAYIGVGPDQNFSYIAELRPAIAFILDVRRDNLLLHLLFKALFDLSRTRVEYLSLLCGRPAPPDVEAWRTKPIAEMAAYIDAAPRPDAAAVTRLRASVADRVARIGVPLGAGDVQTIDRFHRQFIEEGLGLQFRSTGRPPQWNYPTYRQLITETDRSGRQGNYLASEDAFQFVKSLQARDLVVPVVGDLSGPSALGSIARLMRERQERLTAFYASNVEFYLFREGTFPRFVTNLSRLPAADGAVVIRSVFNGGPRVAGYGSASLVQPVAELVDGYARGRFQQYWELAGR